MGETPSKILVSWATFYPRISLLRRHAAWRQRNTKGLKTALANSTFFLLLFIIVQTGLLYVDFFYRQSIQEVAKC